MFCINLIKSALEHQSHTLYYRVSFHRKAFFLDMHFDAVDTRSLKNFILKREPFTKILFCLAVFMAFSILKTKLRKQQKCVSVKRDSIKSNNK